MCERNVRRRRRRRPQSLWAYLLPMTAVMLVGILLAAALTPHAPARVDVPPESQTDQLADRLVGSVSGQDDPLPAPAQKGTVPGRTPE